MSYTLDVDWRNLREAVAALSNSIHHDAVGGYAPNPEELYFPAEHATALALNTSLVLGARGVGKSVWAGVLATPGLLKQASRAYPESRLENAEVALCFSGFIGPDAVTPEQLQELVPENGTPDAARRLWWAVVLRAAERALGQGVADLPTLQRLSIAEREERIKRAAEALKTQGRTLLLLFDAIDTASRTWSHRTSVTQGLLEVIWALRPFSALRPKLFARPDQVEDPALSFVELPKLIATAPRLVWRDAELYGLFFTRIARGPAKTALENVLRDLQLPPPLDPLARSWSLRNAEADQSRLMTALAGRFMSSGTYGFKKGSTYEWPLVHLRDGHGLITPRSFLELLAGAATFGGPPVDQALTPEGLRHGLRIASRTRVDQLSQELPWVKHALAPLVGLALPRRADEVLSAWALAGTFEEIVRDAATNHYPSPLRGDCSGEALLGALIAAGVMTTRRNNNVDMPDLYRVAARLLRRGGVSPDPRR